MTEAEEKALADAFPVHYPKAYLLLVRKADDPNLAGTVERKYPNTYVGLLDRIDLGPAHISYTVWNALCRKVHADWNARRSLAATP